MSHPDTCECLACEQQRFNDVISDRVLTTMEALKGNRPAQEIALRLLKDGWTGTIEELIEAAKRLA